MPTFLAPQESASNLPRKAKFGGYLYIVEFANGSAKVGRSRNPAGRVESHESHAAVFGVDRLRVWVSDLHSNPEETERSLISAGSVMAESVRRKEYLQGVDFSTLVATAEEIDYPHVDFEEEERRINEKVRAFQDAWERQGSPPRVGPGASANDLHKLMGHVFGRFTAEHQYDWSLVTPDDDCGGLFETMIEVAEAKNLPLASILEMSPLEMFVETIQLMVKTEAAGFKAWALGNDRSDLLESYGTHFTEHQCIELSGWLPGLELVR